MYIHKIVKDLCRSKLQDCMHSCTSHVRKLVDMLEAHSAPDSLSWQHSSTIKLAPVLSGDAGHSTICVNAIALAHSYVSCIA